MKNKSGSSKMFLFYQLEIDQDNTSHTCYDYDVYNNFLSNEW